MERKEEVSMLKIRSFLHLTKDSIANLFKRMFLRYSKNMVVTAYALSAIVLVFHFGDLTSTFINSPQLIRAESSYEGNDKSEETNESELIKSDNNEYALISPDNYILAKLTETVDKLPVERIQYDSLKKFSLNQLSISPVTSIAYDHAVTMAILATQPDLFLPTNPNNVLGLFSLETGVQDEANDINDSKTDKNQKKEESSSKKDSGKNKSKEAKETLAISDIKVPANLTLKVNKAMKKSLSNKELEVLQRIVEAEATGEDIYGKILVANVVINRVNSKEFPNTVSEVVFQKAGKTYQFSPTKDGRYWKIKISKETKEAVERALAGEDYSKGAMYFFARKLTTAKKASWFDNKLRKVVQYGCHEFYASK